MKLMLFIFLAIIFMIFVSLLPLRFRFQYRKKEKDDFISVTWQALPGLWGITLEIPFIKVSTASVWPAFKLVTQLEGEKGLKLAEKEKEFALDEHNFRRFIRKFSLIIGRLGELGALGRWFLGKITLREFSWCTEVGTKEAGITGILVGVLWSAKSMIYGYLHKMVRKVKKDPEISVFPDFKEEKAFCNMICIFDISCGHIIIGGIKALSILFLMKKGGDKL